MAARVLGSWAVLLVLPAAAAAAAADDWTARKCALYRDAWAHVARGPAMEGVGPAFRADHAAFLASECRERRVCPENEAERALADLLSLMAVAEGMTGSFLPFVCEG